ncbi:MAG: hypothetical protein IKZ43_06320 [Acidaminococcaceae bacterium]|nr:hypothetical protein [Acidaminococcaceae bacterium]
MVYNFIKIGKVLFLTILLLMEIGCNSISAKTAQGKLVVNNIPVKVETNVKRETPKGICPVNPSNGKIHEIAENGVTTKNTPDAINERTQKTLLKEKEYGYRNADKYLTKYRDNNLVRQIILVEQSTTEICAGKLFLLIKNEKGEWQEHLQCKAFLGKNGINKTREGDAKTPTGDFGMLMAFGAKDDPGSLIPYTKLTETMYLCGDREFYNQFIDVSKVNHICSGNSEHLIRYIPQYNYALFFDFNKENVYGKGSAIFLHCAGKNPFTLGCVSVSEDNMIKILKAVDINSRICIYAAK